MSGMVIRGQVIAESERTHPHCTERVRHGGTGGLEPCDPDRLPWRDSRRLGCLPAPMRWIDVTASVVCSIVKGRTPRSVPIALDPERSRVPLSAIRSLMSSSSSLASQIRPRISRPRTRCAAAGGNRVGAHRDLGDRPGGSGPRRWRASSAAATLVQFASITQGQEPIQDPRGDLLPPPAREGRPDAPLLPLSGAARGLLRGGDLAPGPRDLAEDPDGHRPEAGGLEEGNKGEGVHRQVPTDRRQAGASPRRIRPRPPAD
jgi:hypothetical protein